MGSSSVVSKVAGLSAAGYKGAKFKTVGPNGNYPTIAACFAAIEAEIAAQAPIVTIEMIANFGYNITDPAEGADIVGFETDLCWFNHPTSTNNPKTACTILSTGSVIPIGGVVDNGLIFTCSISAISVAAAAQVTTATNHGLTTGDTAVISNTDSTPVIDGARVVTVIDSNNFTVPVTTTVSGSNGDAAGNRTIDLYDLKLYVVELEDGVVHGDTPDRYEMPAGVIIKGTRAASLGGAELSWESSTGYAEVHGIGHVKLTTTSASNSFGVGIVSDVYDVIIGDSWTPLYYFQMTGGSILTTDTKKVLPCGTHGYCYGVSVLDVTIGSFVKDNIAIPMDVGGTFVYDNLIFDITINDDILSGTAVTPHDIFEVAVAGSSDFTAFIIMKNCIFNIYDSQDAQTVTYNLLKVSGASSSPHVVVLDGNTFNYDDGTSTVTKALVSSKPANTTVYTGTNLNPGGATIGVANTTALSGILF